LDADRIAWPLTVRNISDGDRFTPFGMKHSRLVSDFLTDRKRSVFDKRRQLVVADVSGRIVWLVGERTDNRFRTTANTRQVLTIGVG
ncbi:tRNA lysidine(34) synthetase TilS, partial [Prevotella sp.]|uniref:tRNA lysidine(34) synthetase TilS n=1 Tax=Prevotella sp. TaxID=59823 RepID=UPI0027E39B75